MTGGSSGLGLALSVLLARRGAHVSIVARDPVKLASALAAVEAERTSPDQVLQVFSHSLLTGDEARAALENACAKHDGESPDAAFLCAGAWKPKYWVESTEQELRDGMDGGYWVQAWTAWVRLHSVIHCGIPHAYDAAGRLATNGATEEEWQDRLRIVHSRLHVICRLVRLLACKTCVAR